MPGPIRAELALLVAGLASFAVMGAGQAIYGPALPAFARTLSVTVAEAGLLIPAHWIGCAAGVATMFALGDRVRLWQTVAVMALGAALVGWGPGWGATLAGAALFGMGYGLCTVLMNQRFLASFGARGPAMVSVLNAFAAVGAILSPLAYVALGSRPDLAYGAVAGLAALTLGIALAVPHRRAGPAAPAEAWRPRPAILAFGALAVGIEASLIGLGPVALIALGESEARSAVLLSGFFVTFLLARLGLAPVAHRVPPFALLTGCLGATGLLSLGATVAPAPSFVALGACAGLFFPSYFLCASGLMGHGPRASATIIASGLVGAILAPLGIAPLLGVVGQAAFFWIAGGLALATAGAALRAAPALRPHPA